MFPAACIRENWTKTNEMVYVVSFRSRNSNALGGLIVLARNRVIIIMHHTIQSRILTSAPLCLIQKCRKNTQKEDE